MGGNTGNRNIPCPTIQFYLGNTYDVRTQGTETYLFTGDISYPHRYRLFSCVRACHFWVWNSQPPGTFGTSSASSDGIIGTFSCSTLLLYTAPHAGTLMGVLRHTLVHYRLVSLTDAWLRRSASGQLPFEVDSRWNPCRHLHFSLKAKHFGTWHQFQTQKWEPPFLTSRSHSETLNIFIKPVDTSRLLIIFLDNKWTVHLYHNSFAIYYSSSLLYMLMRHHGCSRPQLQRYLSTFLSKYPYALCQWSCALQEAFLEKVFHL